MTRDFALIISVTMLCMLSPGPDMVLVMRNTLASGRRSGFYTSLGVLSGNFVHIAYCALGVGVLVAHSVVAYSALKFAGAAYLIFLGITGIRNAKKVETRAQNNDALNAKENAPARARSSFFQGFLNNLLNPKGALFYLGVFTQVITPRTAPARAVALVATMVLTSAAFWFVFVATLHLPPVRTLLARSRQTLERAFGVVLVLLGLRVAAQD
jgi:RhtB (resistance to homoserine/threonine) family protein